MVNRRGTAIDTPPPKAESGRRSGRVGPESILAASRIMLYISLTFSAILLLVSVVAVRRSRNLRQTYWKVWLGLPFAYLLFVVLPTYLLHAFLTGVVATVCDLTGKGPRIFTYGAIAAFVCSYLLVGGPRAFELWELRREIPFESLDRRLAYEPKAPISQPDKYFFQLLDDPPESDAVLSADRQTLRKQEMTLRDLHDGCVNLFVNAPGFGVGRMYHLQSADARKADSIRDAARLPLPELPQAGESPPVSTGDLTLQPGQPGLSGLGATDLRSFHRQSADDFLNPLAFGYVRDRGHVVGFISHRFTRWPAAPTKADGVGHWRVESLDLISLLKHAEPVAYVSRNLPRMDELRDAQIRPLDDFESSGLAKLGTGEDLIAAHGARRVRMVAAIRARPACLKCHGADMDELLGAFSYDLRLYQ
jgi:hypothetical protein